EARAVFAQAPSFVFDAAFADGDLQLALRLVRGDVFLAVERREVLAEDFVGAILLDALGAEVPRNDAALSVEHEDRVVLHAFDEKTEQLLAVPQLLLGGAAIGEIAGQFREAEQRAV